VLWRGILGRWVELVKELIRGGLALALASPHHLAALMVGDEREVVVLLLPGHLVNGAFILHLR